MQIATTYVLLFPRTVDTESAASVAPVHVALRGALQAGHCEASVSNHLQQQQQYPSHTQSCVSTQLVKLAQVHAFLLPAAACCVHERGTTCSHGEVDSSAQQGAPALTTCDWGTFHHDPVMVSRVTLGM